MANENFDINKKTKLKRVPKRAISDKQTVYKILDAGFLCHVAFVHENYPVVIPTLYGRSGDEIYIHGSTMSRMLLDLEKGVDVSINICHVDGLVLARSAFHHSMNYRSVVIFGKATLIEGKQEKNDALEKVSEHIIKGRWKEVRGPNDKELKGTKVLRIKLEEVSAKVRTGPPGDENADYKLDIWAGVLPLKTSLLDVEPDPVLKAGISIPPSVLNYKI
jgi:nitroimidazol reductase NimA-like FMN-containing flavoprotein (pyridoxamine 5'-phosphate oxidase superfamily)